MQPLDLDIVNFGPEEMCIWGKAGVGVCPDGSQLYSHLSTDDPWWLWAVGWSNGMSWFTFKVQLCINKIILILLLLLGLSGTGEPCGLYMKRTRARVPIGGQCLLLQISLRIKIFDFLLNSQNYRMNHIFWTPEKIVKLLESRPQSSKNFQNGQKLKKMMM